MELEQRYANASIIEAIIDLKVESSPDVDINSLREIQGEVEFDGRIHPAILAALRGWPQRPRACGSTAWIGLCGSDASRDDLWQRSCRSDGSRDGL